MTSELRIAIPNQVINCRVRYITGYQSGILYLANYIRCYKVRSHP